MHICRWALTNLAIRLPSGLHPSTVQGLHARSVGETQPNQFSAKVGGGRINPMYLLANLWVGKVSCLSGFQNCWTNLRPDFDNYETHTVTDSVREGPRAKFRRLTESLSAVDTPTMQHDTLITELLQQISSVSTLPPSSWHTLHLQTDHHIVST